MSLTTDLIAEEEAPPPRRLAGGRYIAVRIGIALVLVVLALALAYWRSGSTIVVTQAVLTGLLVGGVYGLVAMGLTLIFGVLEIVNFAHGALMTLAMFVTYSVATNAGVGPYVTLLVTIPALFLVGGLIQVGLINRTMGQPLENQLLLTLGIALLLENALLLGYGGDPLTVRISPDTPVRILDAVATTSRLVAFAGAMLLAALLYLMLIRTRLGTAIRAVAANPTGARLVGIDVRRIYVLTFALGTACAGAAGTLVVPFVTITPTTGELFNIIAFVVVVLGGLGRVNGALVGGLIIGLAEQLGGIYFPDQSPLLTVFVVFVLVLFLRPQGLFGRTS